MTEPRVLLGVVVGAHGIAGEVRVKAHTAEPAALKRYGVLLTEDGRALRVKALRETKDQAIVRFEGIDDRNAAEALKGASLYVPRDALPEPGEGEYYHADLVGLAVEDEAGNALGRVRAVHNFGASDVIEIEGAAGATRFLPFTDEIVPTVDIGKGRMVVRPPEEV